MLKQKQVKFLYHASLADLTSSGLNTPEFSYITGENAFYTKIGGVNTLIGGGKFWGLKGNAGTNPSTDFIGTTDNKDLVFKTNNTEVVRILNNGNVGINTTSPSQKLHVAGSMQLDNYIFGYQSRGIMGSDAGGAYFGSLGGTSSTLPTYLVAENSSIRLKTNDTERLRVTETGNIGLNVQNPSTKLHINSTTSGAIRIIDTTEGAGKVLTSDANGVGTWQTPSSFTVYGSYDDDTDAAANGVPIDGVYEYSSTNTEGMPEGVLKRRKN